MSVTHFDGDLLESGCDFICHQVNCQGVMGSGIAKSIKEKWPEVYNIYKHHCLHTDDLLGTVQVYELRNKQTIINMFAQDKYGYNGTRYTSYDAFYNCLCELILHIPKGSRIGFPYGIGCVRGGANWNIIETMIKEVLGKNYQVEIWRFDKG